MRVLPAVEGDFRIWGKDGGLSGDRYFNKGWSCGFFMVGKQERPEAGLAEVEGNGSRAERQIARMLNRYGIRYMYEHPVAVVDRGKVRIWYPDFWLPDYGTLIEYVGGLKDRNYTEGVEHKKSVYEAAGFPAIFLDGHAFDGCWPKKVMNRIEDILRNRLRTFDSLEEVM